MSDKRIERLRELSQAVVDGRIREFDMRIPAEKDRDADYVLDWAAEEIECLNARVAELEKSALLMFNAIALAPVDCMGIVPERYDCPAYPRRDEVLHNAAPPIRHLLEAKDDG